MQLFPVLTSLGQIFDKRKPRRQVVNLFKCCINYKLLERTTSKNPLSELLDNDMFNQNMSKEEIDRRLLLSETVEKENERARALSKFGKRLPYKLQRDDDFKKWQSDLIKNEVRHTKEMYFAIDDFRLFARHQYTSKDPNRKTKERQCFYCDYCFQTFFTKSKVMDDHVACCRGPAGEITR